MLSHSLRKIIYLSTVIIIASLFCGCSLKVKINEVHTDISHLSANLTDSQIERSIFKAAVQTGWRLQRVEQGLVAGDYYFAKYHAGVNINYSRDNYSILYSDSTNLRYDGEKILSFYNTWVDALDKKIKELIGQAAALLRE